MRRPSLLSTGLRTAGERVPLPGIEVEEYARHTLATTDASGFYRHSLPSGGMTFFGFEKAGYQSSRNGTVVNGDKIQGRTELKDGDEIRVFSEKDPAALPSVTAAGRSQGPTSAVSTCWRSPLRKPASAATQTPSTSPSSPDPLPEATDVEVERVVSLIGHPLPSISVGKQGLILAGPSQIPTRGLTAQIGTNGHRATDPP